MRHLQHPSEGACQVSTTIDTLARQSMRLLAAVSCQRLGRSSSCRPEQEINTSWRSVGGRELRRPPRSSFSWASRWNQYPATAARLYTTLSWDSIHGCSVMVVFAFCMGKYNISECLPISMVLLFRTYFLTLIILIQRSIRNQFWIQKKVHRIGFLFRL